MEVRGGTGYIEEWSDARLVRDAHLGSIWEGTSNIVALDIARAVKREGALEPLRAYLIGRLDGVALPPQSDVMLRATLERVCGAIGKVAEDGSDELVRQAGSALYHITTAIFMAVEGVRLAPDHRRLALAHLVLRHKLLPVDPLALPENDDALLLDALVKQREVSFALAVRALPTGDAQ